MRPCPCRRREFSCAEIARDPTPKWPPSLRDSQPHRPLSLADREQPEGARCPQRGFHLLEHRRPEGHREAGHAGGGPGGGSRRGGIGSGGVGLDPGGGSRGASFGALGIRAMRSPFRVAGAGLRPTVARSIRPASSSGRTKLRAGVLLPAATIVKGGNRGLPERVRCFYDLYVMKGLEAQEPPVSVLRGFLEALELGKDSSHCPSRLAGSGRCTSFETSHHLGRARGGSGHSGRYRWPSSRFVTMLSARAAPRPDQVCTSRPTHSEHLSGAKRHVR